MSKAAFPARRLPLPHWTTRCGELFSWDMHATLFISESHGAYGMSFWGVACLCNASAPEPESSPGKHTPTTPPTSMRDKSAVEEAFRGENPGGCTWLRAFAMPDRLMGCCGAARLGNSTSAREPSKPSVNKQAHSGVQHIKEEAHSAVRPSPEAAWQSRPAPRASRCKWHASSVTDSLHGLCPWGSGGIDSPDAPE